LWARYAAVPDGAGGWYIGGHFTAVAGVDRQNLAHILSTGALDSNWNPGANDTVFALATFGDSVVAGGSFTFVDGKTRNRLASSDTFGTVSSWNPNANSTVYTLTIFETLNSAGNPFSTWVAVGGLFQNRQ
jgi:hypothetical protein